MREDSEQPLNLHDIYAGIKERGSKRDYDILLTSVRRAGKLSMNEVAFLKDATPQSVHVKLKRLVECGLLKREKEVGRQNISEYQYFLAPGVDPNQLQKLTGDDLPDEINERLRALLEGDYSEPSKSKSRIEVSPSTSDSQKSSSRPPQPKSAADLLISKLPDFDPAWPEEMQNRWMASFEAITKRLTEESDN